jgi:hypothetical protein
VVFEAVFDDQAQWEAFRARASVQAALAAAPDPLNGLLVHRGGGGSSGAPSSQQPPPLGAAGVVPGPALAKAAGTPAATPPPASIDRWEALRGGLLTFLVVMAIILLTLGFIVLLVLAPALGFSRCYQTPARRTDPPGYRGRSTDDAGGQRRLGRQRRRRKSEPAATGRAGLVNQPADGAAWGRAGAADGGQPAVNIGHWRSIDPQVSGGLVGLARAAGGAEVPFTTTRSTTAPHR